MIIDVTRKPLLILSDDVIDSVVVRTIGNRTVNGIVTYKCQMTRTKSRIVELTPDAQLVRGDSTCYETRLPLPGSAVPLNPFNKVPEYEAAWVREERRERERAGEQPVEILPDPYEVASVYKDSITGLSGAGRFSIRIEKNKRNPKLWVVSVGNTMGDFFCGVVVKDLQPNPLTKEILPLARVVRNKITGTAWDRIMGDD